MAIKIFNSYKEFNHYSNDSVLTIGNFDGIHEGHRQLIKEAKKRATETGTKCMVYTFFPHTRMELKENLLLPVSEKVRLMESLGVDAVIIEPYNEEFASLSGDEFINRVLLESLKIKGLVIGNNFFFGKNRSGTIDLLKKYQQIFNFYLKIVNPVIFKNEMVSSSRIRALLLTGEIEKANAFLGSSYGLFGQVIKGDQRGRTLGFPTVNINPVGQLIPSGGIYAGIVKLKDQIHKAAINIGNNPTFSTGILRVEAYILDFNHDIYGEEISIHLLKRLRDEIKFSSVEKLKEQILLDVEKTRELVIK